jgi:hypothetical protein
MVELVVDLVFKQSAKLQRAHRHVHSGIHGQNDIRETRSLHYEFRVALMSRALTDHNPCGSKSQETSRRGADQSRIRVHGIWQVFHQIWFKKNRPSQHV